MSSACGLRVVLTEPTTLSNLLPPPLLVCACVRLSFALAFCFSVSLQVDPNKPLAPPSANGVRVSSDKYFTPFKLACECRSPKVVRACVRACVLVRGVCVCVCVCESEEHQSCASFARFPVSVWSTFLTREYCTCMCRVQVRTALDSLQKLMAYGHITGTMYAEVRNHNKNKSVCVCVCV